MTTPTDITTGPGYSNPLLTTRNPIIPVTPVTSSTGTYVPASTYEAVYVEPALRQTPISGVGELLPIVYGNDRVKAKITAVVDYNGNLILRCEWCQGPISAIKNIYIDTALSPASVTWTHYTGTQVTADPTLVSAYFAKGKTYTDTLNGVAYSVGVFPPSSTQGFPRPVADINGLKVAQSSGGTPAYSDDPIWLIAWILTQRMGATIDWTLFATAASTNTSVLVSGEKKRIVGLTLDTEQDVATWVDVLRGYAGCYVTYDNGVYGLIPDAVASTAMSLTQDDMREGQITISSRNLRMSPNKVRIAYTDTSGTPWREGFAEVSTGSADRVSEVKMPGIQRYSQAYREAVERLNEFQLNYVSISFVTRDSGLRLQQGDVIEVTHSVGLTSAKFRISDPPQAVEEGRWSIKAWGYSASKYSSTVATAPSYVDTGLASPLSPPTVTGLALTENIEAPGPGGVPSSSISATWTAVNYAFLFAYVIYVYDDAGTLIEQAQVSGTSWRSRALPAPQRYTVYVKARSQIAIASGYDSKSITLSGSTQSLTLLTSTRVYSAGATLSNFQAYTLYPDDPYLRVAPVEDLTPKTFGEQFATNPIGSASSDCVLTYNRYLSNQDRSTTYAKTAAIDLGASKAFIAALSNAPANALAYEGLYPACGFEVADSLAGPWTFGLGSVVGLTGRYVRMVTFPRNYNIPPTFPDGLPTVSIPPGIAQVLELDFGTSTIGVYAPTVEETDTATTSVSGPITITLANKYAAIRDLQVTAIQAGGTAVVTADAISISTTLTNTFQINATSSGTRVAVPVRWSFKGAL